MAPLGDGDAMLALPAGLDRGAAVPSRTDAVHPLGDDPRRRRLADPPDSGHHEGLCDPIRREGIAQRAHHRLLPDQVGEGLGPVFAGENLVFGAVGHLASG